MHGGKRPGSGRKSTWIHGKTTVVRVPEVLADEIIRLAHLLDEGQAVGDVTQSKYLDLSGIVIRTLEGQPAILVKDLLDRGFKIRPLRLIDDLRRKIDRIR